MEVLPIHVLQIILGAAPWRNRKGVQISIVNRVCLGWSSASDSEEVWTSMWLQHFGADITRRYSWQGTPRHSFRSLFCEQQQMWVSRFKYRIKLAPAKFELGFTSCPTYVGEHLNQLWDSNKTPL